MVSALAFALGTILAQPGACDAVQKVSIEVMRVRQEEAPKEFILQAFSYSGIEHFDTFEVIINEAYRAPVETNEMDKYLASLKFGQYMKEACYNELEQFD